MGAGFKMALVLALHLEGFFFSFVVGFLRTFLICAEMLQVGSHVKTLYRQLHCWAFVSSRPRSNHPGPINFYRIFCPLFLNVPRTLSIENVLQMSHFGDKNFRVTLALHLAQVWLSVRVSVCCRKNLPWGGVRAALISVRWCTHSSTKRSYLQRGWIFAGPYSQIDHWEHSRLCTCLTVCSPCWVKNSGFGLMLRQTNARVSWVLCLLVCFFAELLLLCCFCFSFLSVTFTCLWWCG